VTRCQPVDGPIATGEIRRRIEQRLGGRLDSGRKLMGAGAAE
jgi:hypothetical protein